MTLRAPLQNRVTPDGGIVATPARGHFMGNRGGQIHDPKTRTLTGRPWASRRWICCVTRFKGRQRTVMGDGYTELFFLDEVTALAAGHRPCFECRRADAKRFQAAFQAGNKLDHTPSADVMDRMLHADRLVGRLKRTFTDRPENLPDGAMVLIGGQAHALKAGYLFRWSFTGYDVPRRVAQGTFAEVLTPFSICAALKAGYKPHWHESLSG